MSLSFWNSSSTLNAVVNLIDYAGPFVEGVIAYFGFRNLRDEQQADRRKRRERYIIVFAFIAAGLWMVDTKLNHRLSVLQQSESTSRVKEIDPKNRPIETVTATAHFAIKGFDPRAIMMDTSFPWNLTFSLRGQPENVSVLSLNAFRRDIFGNECFMNFTWSPMNSLNPPVLDVAGKTAESLDRCSLYLGTALASPSNAIPKIEITGGEAVLVLNSFVRKRFIFPPQKCQLPVFAVFGVEADTNEASRYPK
jgi:hypothetical protein